MTPHRHRRHGREVGSILLDWKRGGIRIRCATGWPDDRQTLYRLSVVKGALNELARDGQTEILQAFAAGAFTVAEFWAAIQRRDFGRLPTLETAIRLDGALTRWLETTPNRHTRGSREATLRALLVAHPAATLRDLPTLVADLREVCRTDGRASWWNHTRTNAQSLARDVLGRGHAVQRALAILPTLPEVRKQQRRPRTPDQARQIAAGLGDLGPTWWAMCCTGMGPGEMWGAWRIEAPGVLRIDGTKTAHRRRLVPLVCAIAPPPRTVHTLRQRLDLLTPRVTPYDARRSFANWLEAAGIARTRRRLYMGHTEQDQTDTYEWHEVTAYLAADRVLLARYVGEPTDPAVRLA